MIDWMLYCMVVALVVAGAARAAESLARVAGHRLRWIWIGALAVTALLSARSAVQRLPADQSPIALAATAARDTAVPSSDQSVLRAIASAASRLERVVDASLSVAAELIDRRLPASTSRYVLFVWLIASLSLAVVFAVVVARFRRVRRSWPTRDLHDVRVRVSPQVGPVVIGFIHPEIVIPRWLLRRSADEQRLAVAHEQEHMDARDPVLLAIGWLIVILAPWNLALWYMLSRLRLTIELDCDARVLRRGAPARAYGSLLIDVAQNAAPLTFSTLGFADDSSQLYQRILALRPPVVSFARTRAAAAAVLAAGGLAIACRVAPPRGDARPIAGSSDLAPSHGVPTARMTATSGTGAEGTWAPTLAPPPLTANDSSSRVISHLDSVALARRAEPLVLIDGVRSKARDIHQIDPKTISHVEVLKGAAALAEYGDDAQAGVIIITTKPPG